MDCARISERSGRASPQHAGPSGAPRAGPPGRARTSMLTVCLGWIMPHEGRTQ